MNSRSSAVRFASLERLSRISVSRRWLSGAIEACCQIRNGMIVTRVSPSSVLYSHSERIFSESFSTLCTIRFDLEEAAKTLTPQRKLLGPGFYYSLTFDVIILFGSTEFSAQVAWKVNVSRLERCALGGF